MQPAYIVAAGVAALAWVWFLARGQARGVVKRLALRVTLLALSAGLVLMAAQRGLLTRASLGFALALLAAVLIVAVGYLYLVRFCPGCGRMVRNLKTANCPRCSGFLPLHGMTTRLHRPGDDSRWDPSEKRLRPQRSRPLDGPSA